MFVTSYVKRVYEETQARNPGQSEFLQAVAEVFLSLEKYVASRPELEENAILERLVEPDRMVQFRVTWMDDAGRIRVNRGYRAQFSSAIGPYKGGLRFHPTVTESVVKFLGFEQILKNSLTMLPMGAAKGGADFDPKGKSDREIMRFCQSFMTELYRHIGPYCDVPAGDIGVGSREVGFLFGQYKRLTNQFTGVLTGKGKDFGGSLVRTEATGYGLAYLTNEMFHVMKNESLEGKTAVISGSGNVAIYALEKLQQLGVKVLAMSDSGGFVYDEKGINLTIMKQVKETERARISEYARRVSGAVYHDGRNGLWSVPCQLAFPCATQNELNAADARILLQNGVEAVAEGANMPCTQEAVHTLQTAGVLFAPGKAANAGGVATSGLEMSQNSMRDSWTFDEVDARLKSIMINILQNSLLAAEKCGCPGDLIVGANAAGFERVANAMLAQGAY